MTRASAFFHRLIQVVTGAVAVTITVTATAAVPRSIVVDPGHGGHDTGASRDGVHESVIALAVARSLRSRLEDAGYAVTMTRKGDEQISLEDRALIANQASADLFVSIHLNSSNDPRAQGKEFYFQNQMPVDEEAFFLANRENREGADVDAKDRAQQAGLLVAEAAKIPKLNVTDAGVRNDVKRILEDLSRNERVRRSSLLAKALDREWQASPFATRSSSRTIRQAPFFLISNVAMPSVLVEVGFLSHKREGQKLQSAEYQAALADAMAKGIKKYFESLQ